MAPGLRALTWQWRDPKRKVSNLRVSAVRANPGSVELVPAARIPFMLDPGTVARSRDVAAVINADFFDTLRFGDAVPQGAVIVDGRPWFAPKGWSSVLVWNSRGRSRTTHVALDARVSFADSDVRVSALNDPLALGQDLALMTGEWRREYVPDGMAAVIIKSGEVVRVVERTKDLRIPRQGYALVAKGTSTMPRVQVGDSAEVELAIKVADHQKIVHAVGHGGVAMKEAKILAPCSQYESLLRPRSAIAWNEAGQIWFLTASSGKPDRTDGMRHGGTTKEELARLARSMGATSAVILDGGGSTALFADSGDKPVRLDMPAGSWARPVPVLWQMKLRRAW